jgi:hypothetical protein
MFEICSDIELCIYNCAFMCLIIDVHYLKMGEV